MLLCCNVAHYLYKLDCVNDVICSYSVQFPARDMYIVFHCQKLRLLLPRLLPLFFHQSVDQWLCAMTMVFYLLVLLLN